MSPPEGNGSAVARTIAVLRAVRVLGPGTHPLADIATLAGLPRATTHRYLRALVDAGEVETRGCRGRYALSAGHEFGPAATARPAPPMGQTSPAIRAELVALQARTGQIAMIYVPLLVGPPVRICAEHVLGAHGSELAAASRESVQRLWRAPLEADASGLAIMAALGDGPRTGGALGRIREDGFAVGPSPLENRDAIAVAVWKGPAVAGAVALLASRNQMRGTATRNRYIHSVLDCAAAMSGHLTRRGTRP
ncbi:helix-turn-helix domain-containing protein [Streptomyces sp. NBC_00083]|uniref:helix-turn-helix domain-containing protein n=1 Tax=Streptomyces sp. NBC_00083 TaxID=2975647 RepID=UPI00225A0530|nr:helix-turn-helix domain-containing protein [Streptomyces sp. NBC_00083]MCX5387248.1 helix-turn-helix domain-containing protein [Streptomyces sp. NBC_00083]